MYRGWIFAHETGVTAPGAHVLPMELCNIHGEACPTSMTQHVHAIDAADVWYWDRTKGWKFYKGGRLSLSFKRGFRQRQGSIPMMC